jgi:hypothetical protein
MADMSRHSMGSKMPSFTCVCMPCYLGARPPVEPAGGAGAADGVSGSGGAGGAGEANGEEIGTGLASALAGGAWVPQRKQSPGTWVPTLEVRAVPCCRLTVAWFLAHRRPRRHHARDRHGCNMCSRTVRPNHRKHQRALEKIQIHLCTMWRGLLE